MDFEEPVEPLPKRRLPLPKATWLTQAPAAVSAAWSAMGAESDSDIADMYIDEKDVVESLVATCSAEECAAAVAAWGAARRTAAIHLRHLAADVVQHIDEAESTARSQLASSSGIRLRPMTVIPPPPPKRSKQVVPVTRSTCDSGAVLSSSSGAGKGARDDFMEDPAAEAILSSFCQIYLALGNRGSMWQDGDQPEDAE